LKKKKKNKKQGKKRKKKKKKKKQRPGNPVSIRGIHRQSISAKKRTRSASRHKKVGLHAFRRFRTKYGGVRVQEDLNSFLAGPAKDSDTDFMRMG